MSSERISSKTDLTQGPVTKKLILFALPIVAGNLFTQLYNVTDSVVIGQFIGSDALAAVTVSFPIMMLFNSLFMGLSMGATVLISQYRGAKDFSALERAVNSTFSICILVAAVVTVLGIPLSRPVLQWIGTPDNILDDATLYLVLIFAGTLGNTIYFMSAGLLRGLGDSTWPLYSLITACVINLVLDVLFVAGFGWGVAGVAIATAIAQGISGMILVIRFIRGKYGFKLTLRGMKRIDKYMAVQIFRLGIPSSVQAAAMSMGMLIVQSFANSFGSDFIAANGIIQRADGFLIMPLMGIGVAVTTFVGQNIGAGDVERAKKGTYKSIQITIGLCFVLGVLMYFFGIYFMRAFTDNRHVLDMGFRGLRFLSFIYVFMGINHCLTGAVRGAGEAKVPAITAILSNLIRIPIAYLLAIIPFNYMGLFHSMGISMAAGAAMITLYYIFGKWQNKSVVKKHLT
ncbi:MAG: MATE family efflux transporter [Treponema sp.]|nr:MATE family efflux transporter [Treponema sp.]